MDFFDAVYKRGSYRGTFLPDPVPAEDVRRILDAGVRAPSGYNQQTTSFIVVTDKELINELSKIVPAPVVETAPAVIVPISTYWESPAGLSFEVEDYACAAESILLAITALGYGAVLMDGQAKQPGKKERIGALLQLPPGWTVRALIPFGIPTGEVTQKEKQPIEKRAYKNTFGSQMD